MKLLLRRDQRAGLTGKVIFSLDVRASLSQQEVENLKKYKLADTLLYSSHEMLDRGKGLLGVASRLAWKMTTITVTVKDLANGKRLEAKDIIEMLAIEDQIREAAITFKAVLDAAAHFGGEEAIEV